MTRHPRLAVAAACAAFWALPAAAYALHLYGPTWAVRAAAYLIGGTGIGLVLFGWGYLKGIRDSDTEVQMLRGLLDDTRHELRDFPSSVIWADFDRTRRRS